MGGHFMRLIHSTTILMEKYFRQEDGDAPEQDRELAHALKDYAIFHYRKFHDARDDREDLDSEDEEGPHRVHRRHTEYIAAWDAFLEFFDGSLLSGFFGRKRRSDENCLRTLRERGVKVFIDLVYRFQPPVPFDGKWTHTEECIDFFMVSWCVIPMLPRAFEIAYGPLKHRIADSDDVNKDIEREIQWSEVAGKRHRIAMKNLKSEELAISTKNLGSQHPEVVASIGNLAQLLTYLGKPDEAQSLYCQ